MMNDMWRSPRFVQPVSPWSPMRGCQPVYDYDWEMYQAQDMYQMPDMYQTYPGMPEYVPGTRSCQSDVWIPGQDEELEAEQDLEYLMSLCPYQVRCMQRHVERVCDGFEYAHSMLYDEVPDQTALRCLRNKVLEEAAKDPCLFGDNGYFDSPESPAARDMAEILVNYEVAARRRKHRR